LKKDFKNMVKKNFCFFNLLVFIAIFYAPAIYTMRVKKFDLGPTKVLDWVENHETGYTTVTLQKMGDGIEAKYSGDELHYELNGYTREIKLDNEEAKERWKRLESEEDIK
jgi:hypothetical protein